MRKISLLCMSLIVLFVITSCGNKGENGSSLKDKVEEKTSDAVNEAFGGDMFKAAREGDLETIKEGIKAGEDVNQTNAYSETMLMKAAESGHFEVVKCLLDEGADKTKTDIYDNTAATMTNDDEIREYIKNYGEEEAEAEEEVEEEVVEENKEE